MFELNADKCFRKHFAIIRKCRLRQFIAGNHNLAPAQHCQPAGFSNGLGHSIYGNHLPMPSEAVFQSCVSKMVLQDLTHNRFAMVNDASLPRSQEFDVSESAPHDDPERTNALLQKESWTIRRSVVEQSFD